MKEGSSPRVEESEFSGETVKRRRSKVRFGDTTCSQIDQKFTILNLLGKDWYKGIIKT